MGRYIQISDRIVSHILTNASSFLQLRPFIKAFILRWATLNAAILYIELSEISKIVLIRYFYFGKHIFNSPGSMKLCLLKARIRMPQHVFSWKNEVWENQKC